MNIWERVLYHFFTAKGNQGAIFAAAYQFFISH